MGLVWIAGEKFLSSGLSGNGPADIGMRNVMRDTGWEMNTIELGGKRVPLDIFEPFGFILKETKFPLSSLPQCPIRAASSSQAPSPRLIQ